MVHKKMEASTVKGKPYRYVHPKKTNEETCLINNVKRLWAAVYNITDAVHDCQ